MRKIRFLTTAFLALAGACAPVGDAPESADRVYVETLGTDTMAIERFTRDDDGIEGTLVTRAPVTEVHRYSAELGSDGDVTRLTGTISVPSANAGARPDRSYEYVVRGDSADLVTVSGTDTTRTTVGLPEGALAVPPRIPAPPSFLELATERLPQGAEDAVLNLVNPFAARPTPSGLVRRDDGTVGILYFGSPLLVTHGADGALQTVSGRETTVRIEVAPADTTLDVEALADGYAARDAAGTGVGVPSPADTARATVAGSELEVAYSQPAARGRELWGGLVPFGSVWRTGANAATTLATSSDIELGGVAVPAGEYTLWTLFSEDGGELIVNSQTGQWGTAYDEAQDLARVDLDMESNEEFVERFTIGVEGEADGGRLTLSWGDRTYFVTIAPG